MARKIKTPVPARDRSKRAAAIASSSKTTGVLVRARKPYGSAKRSVTVSDKVTRRKTRVGAGGRVGAAGGKGMGKDKGKGEGDDDGAPANSNQEEGEDHEEPALAYWLMKSEPESRVEKGVDVKFSIEDLENAKGAVVWDGVRNPTARNNMKAMKKGDLAFFYHSNCKVPGIVGLMEIVEEHSVDDSAHDPKNLYYDARSTPDAPKWSVVHVAFNKKFPNIIPLKELQKYSVAGGVLEGMQTLKRARLSVSMVSKEEFEFVMGLVEKEGGGKGEGKGEGKGGS